MDQATLSYRFSRDGFVRAWEAGAFEGQRVELIEGEIWQPNRSAWLVRR